MYASFNGFTDVVRELIAADGSAEHLRMKDKYGKTALDYMYYGNDEIKALFTVAKSAADGGAAAPPPEGKEREGEEEYQD